MKIYGIAIAICLLLAVSGQAQEPGKIPPKPAPEIDPAETCAGKDPGASCWMEIAERPGCYTWNPNLQANETVTWSGECSDALAQGAGSRQWSHPDDEGNPLVSGGEGELRDGKPHGPWSHYNSDGSMEEGTREHGERHGPWTHLFADGTLFEGKWANGQRRGKWTSTYGDDVGGGFYVAGKRHGRWRVLFAAPDDETVRGVREGSYVAGKQNGRWITRFESGTVHEFTYQHGVPHGPSSSRFADGGKREGSYENGEREGRWSFVNSNGGRESGSYKAGVRTGEWVYKDADGDTRTGETRDGKREGHWSFTYSNGRQESGSYKAGLRTGEWVRTEGDKGWRAMFVDGKGDWKKHGWWSDKSGKGEYVDGVKTGEWIESWSRVLGPIDYRGRYVDGKRHGYWSLRRPKRNDHFRAEVEVGSYEHGKKHGFWKEKEKCHSVNGASDSIRYYGNGSQHDKIQASYYRSPCIPEVFIEKASIGGKRVSPKRWRKWVRRIGKERGHHVPDVPAL